MSNRLTGKPLPRWRVVLTPLLFLSLIVQMLGTALPAFASSVTSVTLTGGAGTATVGGTLYARSGQSLTLAVTTSSDTKCVDVTGFASPLHQTSTNGKSSWTFSLTAGTGDGGQTLTAAA